MYEYCLLNPDAKERAVEERNKALATKAREDQLAELVKLKREMLNRSVESGEAVASEEPKKVGPDSWD